jgi:hypothetical protein
MAKSGPFSRASIWIDIFIFMLVPTAIIWLEVFGVLDTTMLDMPLIGIFLLASAKITTLTLAVGLTVLFVMGVTYPLHRKARFRKVAIAAWLLTIGMVGYGVWVGSAFEYGTLFPDSGGFFLPIPWAS